jgi:hypothetical protein
MLARAAGLSMAISNEHSAKPFAATIAKNGYLVLGIWLLLRRHSPYPSDDKLAAKYQVPNTFIPLCPLWLSSLAER